MPTRTETYEQIELQMQHAYFAQEKPINDILAMVRSAQESKGRRRGHDLVGLAPLVGGHQEGAYNSSTPAVRFYKLTKTAEP